MSPRLGAHAIGQVRQLRRRLVDDAEKLTARANAIPSNILTGAAFRRPNPAAPDWARILARMPPPFIMDRVGRRALWRLPRPVGQVAGTDDALEGDQVVLMQCLVVGRINAAAAAYVDNWGIAFSDHALGRVLERTGFEADPLEALLDAHTLLLGASEATAGTITAVQRWAVPGGPGAFLCTMRTTVDDGPPLQVLTAETWVSADELYPEQEAQVAAIRWRQPGPTLGDGLLRPAVLRAEQERNQTDTNDDKRR